MYPGWKVLSKQHHPAHPAANPGATPPRVAETLGTHSCNAGDRGCSTCGGFIRWTLGMVGGIFVGLIINSNNNINKEKHGNKNVKFDPSLGSAFLLCQRMSLHNPCRHVWHQSPYYPWCPFLIIFAPQDGTADISNLQAWLNLREIHHHFTFVLSGHALGFCTLKTGLFQLVAINDVQIACVSNKMSEGSIFRFDTSFRQWRKSVHHNES